MALRDKLKRRAKSPPPAAAAPHPSKAPAPPTSSSTTTPAPPPPPPPPQISASTSTSSSGSTCTTPFPEKNRGIDSSVNSDAKDEGGGGEGAKKKNKNKNSVVVGRRVLLSAPRSFGGISSLGATPIATSTSTSTPSPGSFPTTSSTDSTPTERNAETHAPKHADAPTDLGKVQVQVQGNGGEGTKATTRSDERVRRLDERVSEVYPHLAPPPPPKSSSRSVSATSSSLNTNANATSSSPYANPNASPELAPAPSPRGPRPAPRSVSSPTPTPSHSQYPLASSSSSSSSSSGPKAVQGLLNSTARERNSSSSSCGTSPEGSLGGSGSLGQSKGAKGGKEKEKIASTTRDASTSSHTYDKLSSSSSNTTKLSKRASWIAHRCPSPDDASLPPPLPTPASIRLTLHAHVYHVLLYHPTTDLGGRARVGEEERVGVDVGWGWVVVPSIGGGGGEGGGGEGGGSDRSVSRTDAGKERVEGGEVEGRREVEGNREGSGEGSKRHKGKEDKDKESSKEGSKGGKERMELSLNASWPLLLGKEDCIFKGPGEVLKRGTWIVPCISTSGSTGRGGEEERGGEIGRGGERWRQYVARVVGWEGKVERITDVPTTLPRQGETYITPPEPSPYPSTTTGSVQYLMCVLGEATASGLLDDSDECPPASAFGSTPTSTDLTSTSTTTTSTTTTTTTTTTKATHGHAHEHKHKHTQSVGSTGSPLDGEFELVQSFEEWKRGQVGEVRRVEEGGRGWWMRVVDVLSVGDAPPASDSGSGSMVIAGTGRAKDRVSGGKVDRKKEKEKEKERKKESERKKEREKEVKRKTSQVSTSNSTSTPSTTSTLPHSKLKMKWSFSNPAARLSNASVRSSNVPASAPVPAPTSTQATAQTPTPTATAQTPVAIGTGTGTGTSTSTFKSESKSESLAPPPNPPIPSVSSLPPPPSSAPAVGSSSSSSFSFAPLSSPSFAHAHAQQSARPAPRRTSTLMATPVSVPLAPPASAPASTSSGGFGKGIANWNGKPKVTPRPVPTRTSTLPAQLLSSFSSPPPPPPPHSPNSGNTGYGERPGMRSRKASEAIISLLQCESAPGTPGPSSPVGGSFFPNTPYGSTSGGAAGFPASGVVSAFGKHRRTSTSTSVGVGSSNGSGIGSPAREEEDPLVKLQSQLLSQPLLSSKAGKDTSLKDGRGQAPRYKIRTSKEPKGRRYVSDPMGLQGSAGGEEREVEKEGDEGKDEGIGKETKPMQERRSSSVDRLEERGVARCVADAQGVVNVKGKDTGTPRPARPQFAQRASTVRLVSGSREEERLPFEWDSGSVFGEPSPVAANFPSSSTTTPASTMGGAKRPPAVTVHSSPVVRAPPMRSCSTPVITTRSSPAVQVQSPGVVVRSTSDAPEVPMKEAEERGKRSVAPSSWTATLQRPFLGKAVSVLSTISSVSASTGTTEGDKSRGSVVSKVESSVGSVDEREDVRKRIGLGRASVVNTDSLVSSVHLSDLARQHQQQLRDDEGRGGGGREMVVSVSVVDTESLMSSIHLDQLHRVSQLPPAADQLEKGGEGSREEVKKGGGLPDFGRESLSAGFFDEVLAAVPTTSSNNAAKVRGELGGGAKEGEKGLTKKGRKKEEEKWKKEEEKGRKDEGSGTMKWKDYVRKMSGPSSSSAVSPSAQPQPQASTSGTGSSGKKSRTSTLPANAPPAGASSSSSANAAAGEGVSSSARKVDTAEKEKKEKKKSSGSRFVEGDEIGEGLPVKVRDPSLRR